MRGHFVIGVSAAMMMSTVCFSLFPGQAQAQTDCNQLARDLVTKNLSSASSDYYKLLFLSRAPRKIAATDRAPQDCRRMIPVCSRSDS
jgi:hypothetical protein